MTLTEFLLERIAEDEVLARTADEDVAEAGWEGDGFWTDPISEPAGSNPWGAQEEHIRTFRPSRILAECEAKRRIVLGDQHDATDDQLVSRILAEVYANHPDYDEAWRVGVS